MEIRLNGEVKPVEVKKDEKINVVLLLDKLGIEQRLGLAVALNEVVVPRSRWEDQLIADGDEVELVRAFQGG